MSSEPTITFIRPQQLTTKAPYAYAAVTGPGEFVFTAGACPLDADGNTVAVGDVAGQTRRTMANLVLALQAAGAQLTDVVKTTVFVASSQQADLGAAWGVVRAAFGDHDPPSTLLGVSVLGYDDQLVEVEAIAVCPQRSRDQRLRSRDGLGSGVAVRLHHVQVSMPRGQESLARRFYRDALGLTEVDKPAALAERGGCWFRSYAGADVAAEIHLGVEDAFVPAAKAHPGLVVDSVAELERLGERLAGHGFEVSWTERDSFEGYVRFHCLDGFGNRVEILATAPRWAG